MITSEYRIIGVMSGTSLDGIDLAHITFTSNFGKWDFEIHESETLPYNDYWKNTLKTLIHFSQDELLDIDIVYTQYLGKNIHNFINKHNLHGQLDGVCSHGHTALHQPEQGLTYQIGNRRELAVLVNTTIVCDFRVQDVKLGGQGAPLVPIGDRLLFSQYEHCLNLGGFANISSEHNGQRIAYDICPVNIILNHYITKLGLAFDNKGVLASTGEIQKELLSELNNLEFYKLKWPKSLGLEWVIETVLPLIDSYNLEIKDILRTVVEHVAIQIASCTNANEKGRILVTGGGVYNTFLMECIEAHSTHNIIIPQDEIVEFKEALVFGLLGVLKLRDEINCLSSVTGAAQDHSSGRIFKAEI